MRSKRIGAYIDRCQHILMKCCTNLLDFYRRLSVDQLITFLTGLHFSTHMDDWQSSKGQAARAISSDSLIFAIPSSWLEGQVGSRLGTVLYDARTTTPADLDQICWSGFRNIDSHEEQSCLLARSCQCFE